MRLFPALLAVLALAGCSGMNRGGKWPTLAPRPGEISPLVPRTPLGACAGCGQDITIEPVVPPAPVVVPVPADTMRRLDAVASALAAVETALPAQQRRTSAAIAAARGRDDSSNVAVEADLQRSRLEALFLPIDVQAKQLDDLEDALAGTTGSEPYRERIAALRARIATFEAARGAD